MIEAKIPSNEKERLACLRDLKILDTPIEQRFERLTRIVCRALDVPIAAISLVDEQRQWFKSIQGLNCSQTSRDVAFCSHTILQNEVMIVPDALEDPRFCENPLVLEDPFIRFYAGFPLTIGDNFRIGTLCAIDQKPRTFSDSQTIVFKDLAEMIQSELSNIELTETHQILINDLKDAERAALIDGLTRLWNRVGAEKLMDREWSAASRNQSEISIAMVDVDNFKAINDEYGHCVGDEVLKHLSQVIQTTLRPYDVVARWGGDEFLILMPGCETQNLYRTLERIKIAIDEMPAQTEAGELSITVSMGAITACPSGGDDVMAFLKLADQAMYEAKNLGRDQYVVDSRDNHRLLMVT